MAKFEQLDLLKIGNTIQIVGAIWAGEGRMYLCMFPGEHGYIDEIEGNDGTMFQTSDGESLYAEALNMSIEEWQQFIRQTDIMEAEVIAEGPDGKPVKAVVRKSGRQIAQHVSWAVYHRDGFKCRYCGRGPGIPLTVDHLVLWEEGGPNTEDNLVSACRKCNKRRGNLPYDQWLTHPAYLAVSKGLIREVRDANQALVPTLKDIPRMLHKPSKRK